MHVIQNNLRTLGFAHQLGCKNTCYNCIVTVARQDKCQRMPHLQIRDADLEIQQECLENDHFLKPFFCDNYALQRFYLGSIKNSEGDEKEFFIKLSVELKACLESNTAYAKDEYIFHAPGLLQRLEMFFQRRIGPGSYVGHCTCT